MDGIFCAGNHAGACTHTFNRPIYNHLIARVFNNGNFGNPYENPWE